MTTKSQTAHGILRRTAKGFTLVELIITIGLIAVLSTIAVGVAAHISRSAQETKVNSDVATLNSAIKIYLANGGDLSGKTTPDSVLLKLKTTRTKAAQDTHIGAPSGRMIDPRIVSSPVAASDWRTRASYNPATFRFEVVSDGSAGVEFKLDPSFNEMTIPTEDRNDLVAYNDDSSEWVKVNGKWVKSGGGGWVWNSLQIKNPDGFEGQNRANTSYAPTDTIPVVPVDPPVDPPSDGSDGGDGSGDADDSGDGSGSADGSSDGDDGDPEDPPVPHLPYPGFDKVGGGYPDNEFPLTVTLTNLPDPSEGSAIVQIGSGAWQPYSGSISVPMNTTIRAQYVTANPDNFQDGGQSSQRYYPVVTGFTGRVEGGFHTPAGGPTLLSTTSQNDTFFSHGNPQIDLDGEILDAGEPNTLKFQKTNVTGAAPGQEFSLGSVQYHNGTTFNDSHASGVKLWVSIALQDPAQTLAFDLDLSLVNTDNTDDADASADYVKITNLSQNIPLTVNGVGYKIQLSFEAADTNGFSTNDSFHVYEGATGTGNIKGTFIALP